LATICPSIRAIRVKKLPFDRRHNSKVDYVELKSMMSRVSS
jgi:hypothetical protein